ncbi:MAG: sporulation integral membrane protein YlbJ [Gorillibacterium sp.]|nr:sporulation integral membrane protein YlbJ [Gorillibacterium sp.]
MKRTLPHALYVIAAASILVLFLFLAYPAEGLSAAIKGTAIWWDVLFPALFPFFLISELMLGFGTVHFFGTLLDPLMRPLFRIPGIGGFVMAMGFASGYPVGARLTSRLWEQGLISRDEGERLVAFTTSSDPIFLIGAVSVGFFGDMKVAVLLAIAHYGSAMLLGLLMRYHGSKPTPQHHSLPSQLRPYNSKKKSMLARSFEAMHQARILDKRPLGILLKQSINSSIQLVLVVGGLVVLFSVFLEGLKQSGLLLLLMVPVEGLLHATGLPATLSDALVGGLFEVTLGAKAAGQAAQVALEFKMAAAAFILSWGGLSVHAQVVSLLHKTDLRYYPFFLARLLHGFMAAALVFILWKPLGPVRLQETFVSHPSATPLSASWLERYISFPASLFTLIIIIVSLCVINFLHWILKQLYNRLD